MNVNNLRPVVRGMYQLQRLRIQMGNRIVGNWKVKMGQEPGRSEDELDAEGKKILAMLRASYKRLTDGLVDFPRQRGFVGDGVIDTYTELCLIASYLEIEGREQEQVKRLTNILKEHPLWTDVLQHIKGVGPMLAGVLLSEIDIAKARYPSSLWKYAGLDVAPDGAGRSKRAEHLIEKEYVTKKGETATRMSITYNPFLKTKLLGVLAGSFLRCGDNKYSRVYYAYKHRLECHPVHGQKIKAQRHRMAQRYMIKMFLLDLYTAWRELEGLTVTVPYDEAKLNHVHVA